MFKRFASNEITFERMSGHVLRRLTYLKSLRIWNSHEVGKANLRRLAELKDSHIGQTCVVICNGPSLNKTDMSMLKDHVTFCMNRSYLMFDEWGFVPTYFSITNELVLRQFLDDIRNLPMPKFTPFDFRELLRPIDGATYFRLPPRLTDTFVGDMAKPLSSGGTVTFVTLQIAYFLGFSKVVIVGMDHRFKAKGVPSTAEVRKGDVDEDHVHPNYFPKGMKWELPDLVRSELAYKQARVAYDWRGRRIIDATVDGACTVFEKMPLKEALQA